MICSFREYSGAKLIAAIISAFIQNFLVSVPVKLLTRLVECEMAVGADTQNLNGDFALCDNFLELFDIGINVTGALGNIGICLVDIDVIEKIGVHEVAVALVMAGLKTDIFVEVYGADLGEVESFFTATAGKLLIHADGAGTGSTTPDA